MDYRNEIEAAIAAVSKVADLLPGVFIVHNIQTDCVEYMSRWGRESLGVTNEELKAMGDSYHTRFFNPVDAADYVPKLFAMMQRNQVDEVITFFQQVRPNENSDFSWYFTSVKVLLRDQENKPLLCVSIANPIDPQHHLTRKISRLLAENNFLKNNSDLYAALSGREREILRFCAMGKSSQEISNALFISIHTVETHRKNIRNKLNAHTPFELAEFARAFDLI